MLLTLLYSDYKIIKQSTAVNELCDKIFFIVLRSGGELITVMFFIIGIIITVESKNIERKTKFEKTYQKFNQ